MAVTFSNQQYKSTMGFTAAMIGTMAAYWKARVDACKSADFDDCKDRTHEYLFGEFRNATMKFFVDCINMFFIIISFMTVGIFYNKLPRSIQSTLVFIILALSLWSLACGYKSIEQEDETNRETFEEKRPEYKTLIETKEPLLAIGLKKLEEGKAQLKLVEEANKKTPNVPAIVTKLNMAKQLVEKGQLEYDAGVAQLELGKSVVKGIDNLEEKYKQYRESVMALVIINFAIILIIAIFHIFLTPIDELKVKNTKLEQVTTSDLENFKQNKNIEMNAQNAM